MSMSGLQCSCDVGTLRANSSHTDQCGSRKSPWCRAYKIHEVPLSKMGPKTATCGIVCYSAVSHLLAHFSSFVLNLQSRLWSYSRPQIPHQFCVPSFFGYYPTCRTWTKTPFTECENGGLNKPEVKTWNRTSTKNSSEWKVTHMQDSYFYRAEKHNLCRSRVLA